MNRTTKSVMLTAGLAALLAGPATVLAQPGPGGPGGGNFDPAAMRQRMMDRTKEALEVTSDDEWKVLEPRVQKVMEARMGIGFGGRGMFGRGPRGGGNNPPGDQAQQRPRFGPPPSAEEEALQKAIDAKATNGEIKAALAKFVESRKAKQGELEQAQAELRKLLTPRQEAIATMRGLL